MHKFAPKCAMPLENGQKLCYTKVTAAGPKAGKRQRKDTQKAVRRRNEVTYVLSLPYRAGDRHG